MFLLLLLAKNEQVSDAFFMHGRKSQKLLGAMKSFRQANFLKRGGQQEHEYGKSYVNFTASTCIDVCKCLSTSTKISSKCRKIASHVTISVDTSPMSRKKKNTDCLSVDLGKSVKMK